MIYDLAAKVNVFELNRKAYNVKNENKINPKLYNIEFQYVNKKDFRKSSESLLFELLKECIDNQVQIILILFLWRILVNILVVE